MATEAATTFVLIHGGGSSSWDWHLVEPELRRLGHGTLAVDLPIENPDNGIAEFADAVVAECAGLTRPVIVAHSLGGLTAPVVCSRLEAELLVLVTAMIPKPGETPSEWWSNTGFNDLGVSIDTREEQIDAFFTGVPEPLIEAAFAHEREQNGGGWGEPWPLQTWPDVPTRYLLCRDDEFFAADFTRRHVAERLGITPDEIDGGHMIALQHPKALAEKLHEIWSEQRSTVTG
jgi:pimeloyl-ACP methyl ester carboxylesterase